MNLKTQNKTYNITKIVHENDGLGVLCGIARDSEYGECFIKIINYGKFEKEADRKRCFDMAKTEAITLEKVSAVVNNTPKVYDCFNNKAERKYIIVMQKMPGITLGEWMKKHPVSKIDDKSFYARRKIIYQICKTMETIRKKHPSIIHRDLKPDNILIRFEDKRWMISIVDFGCAGLNFVRKVGTTGYCAPEQSEIYCKNLSVNYGPQTDIFAIGQIYYHLLLGYAPVFGRDYIKSASDNKWETHPSLPQNLLEMRDGKTIDSLLKKMTLFDPDDRNYLEYSRIINILK